MSQTRLMGQARLMQMMFNGDDLSNTAEVLLHVAQNDPHNADALLDLSTILLLRGDQQVALSMQLQALSIQQRFTLQTSGELRLLILKTPGDFMTNSPVEFLIDTPQIAADILYIAPDLPYPTNLDYDLVYNAISEGKQNEVALKLASTLTRQWQLPTINRADDIPLLSRDRACELIDLLPGIHMPQNLILQRQEVEALAQTTAQLNQFLAADQFPILIRPVDSHAGQGLARVTQQQEIQQYLESAHADAFYVSPFVDYRSNDGQFRKYRIAFVGGRAHLCHMAISDHWMIHYLNAGMTSSEVKRAEEASAMKHFEERFVKKHAHALSALCNTFDLEYFCIDCAETRDGQILVFEAGNAMVVHNMDPVDLFPYKQPVMQRLFNDFQNLLFDTIKVEA